VVAEPVGDLVRKLAHDARKQGVVKALVLQRVDEEGGGWCYTLKRAPKVARRRGHATRGGRSAAAGEWRGGSCTGDDGEEEEESEA
jgi:hypothetical protein